MNDVFGSERREALITASRLRAWWLITFRGYNVAREMEQPVEGTFGRIRFVHLWALEGPDFSVIQSKEDGME